MGGANGKIAASVRVLPIRVVGYKGGVGAPRLAPGSRYVARLRRLRNKMGCCSQGLRPGLLYAARLRGLPAGIPHPAGPTPP